MNFEICHQCTLSSIDHDALSKPNHSSSTHYQLQDEPVKKWHVLDEATAKRRLHSHGLWPTGSRGCLEASRCDAMIESHDDSTGNTTAREDG
jgi:hypothetical protein